MFWTTIEGQGWGIRTDICVGSFMFTFVGDIITNFEMVIHNKYYVECQRHAYNVVLVDKAMENVLNDEQTLCLDGNIYKNIGIFLNHQCNDVNLLDIPMQIEIVSAHIYHVCGAIDTYIYQDSFF